jgi:Ulp1 family protease
VNTELQQGQHWLLALLKNGHFRNLNSHHQLYLFDSGWSGPSVANTIRERLQHFESVVSEQSLKVRVCEVEKVPKQNNGYDCGVFAVGFCEYILLEMVE